MARLSRDVRERLGEALDQINDAQITELIEGSLSAEKLVWAFCPECNHKVRVDYPDLDKRAKFLATFLDQAKGKPAEKKTVEVNVTARRLRDMSDEELDAVIEGRARELTAGS